MEQITNQILLRGSLAALPVLSHETHGKRYFRFLLEVERLSGVADTLPVLAAEAVLNRMDVSGGNMVEVTGQLRTFNSRAGTGRRLIISVHADVVTACEGEPENRVELTGVLCREPVWRRTPLGREICDGMLAVNRNCHRTDYLPCIFWGRTAAQVNLCSVGDQVSLVGRFQSRDYIKVLEDRTEQRTAYEVSVMTAEIF